MLSLADVDASEGAALTDGDEDEEGAAVMVLDGDCVFELEGVLVVVVLADGAAVTDRDDDDDAVLEGDVDSEGVALGTQADASDCGSRTQLGCSHDAEHASTVMQLCDMSK
jgi:hypothetical protein